MKLIHILIGALLLSGVWGFPRPDDSDEDDSVGDDDSGDVDARGTFSPPIFSLFQLSKFISYNSNNIT